MTEDQENLLVAIRNALEARPDRPSYDDYVNGKMSREEYLHLDFQYELVNQIRNALRQGIDGEAW